MLSPPHCFDVEPLDLADACPARVLVIDHHDSYTYNLVHLIASLGARSRVVTSDDDESLRPEAEARATPENAATTARDFDAILLSPGPCGPDRADAARAALAAHGGRVPFFGVCLGHQVIAHEFGARIVRVSPMHGKPDLIEHDGEGIYRGLPCPFRATRYHSLAVDPSSVPAGFEVAAWSRDGTIMGLRHRRLALDSVQFHPESVASTHGADLLQNWLRKIPIAAGEPGL